MTKYEVNEIVYVDYAISYAERKIVRAIRERKFFKPLYLLTDINNKDDPFAQWVSESKLAKDSDENN